MAIARWTFAVWVLAFSLSGFAADSSATTQKFRFDTIDHGWYDEFGFHIAINNNSLTGICNGFEYNSFYLWDLTPLSGRKVTAARVSVLVRAGLGAHLTTQTGNMFGVRSESYFTLQMDNGAGFGREIFDDLGHGDDYGSFQISPIKTDRIVNFDLNSTGVDRINQALGGEFAIGMRNTTIDQRHYFRLTGGEVNEKVTLILTVEN